MGGGLSTATACTWLLRCLLYALGKFSTLLSGKPGNAVPSIRKRHSNTLKPLNEANVPTEERSVRMFEAQGGQLQRECRVGQDLLSGDDVRQQQREQLFFEKHTPLKTYLLLSWVEILSPLKMV